MQKANAILVNYVQICISLLIFVLLILLPQINVSGYVQATITSKLIYFLYSCLVLLGFYTVYIVSVKSIAFSFSKLDLALFALVSYITLNRYLIQPHFGFSIRYMELIGLSFLYVVLRRLSLKNYPWLLLAIVISGILQAVYGNLQLLGCYSSNHSGFKMTGSFFNPGPYAGFLVSVYPITLGMYLFKDKIISQVQSQIKKDFIYLNEFIKQAFEYIPLLGIISIAIVLPATQSRAAWIAAISSSLVLLEFRYSILKGLFEKINTVKKTVLIVLSIGILSTGLFGVYHLKKGSSDGRLFIWKVTTEMIANTPFFGVGFDEFKANYMNYQASYFAKNGETTEALLADNVYYAFNEWLQFIVENGLIGFIFLMIAIFVLFKMKGDYKPLSLVVKTGLFSIGVFACFSYPMQILPIKIVIVTAFALLACLDLNVCKFKLSQNNIGNIVFKTSLLLLAIIGIAKGSLCINELNKGFKTWQTAADPFLDYETVLKEYEIAYPIFKNQGDFLMGYGKTLSLAEKNAKAITILQQAEQYLNNTVIQTALGDAYKGTKQYQKAEIAYKQAYNMCPTRFYSMYLLVKLYDESNDKKKAVIMINKMLNKKVKIPSTAVKEIREEMKKIKIKYNNI